MLYCSFTLYVVRESCTNHLKLELYEYEAVEQWQGGGGPGVVGQTHDPRFSRTGIETERRG